MANVLLISLRDPYLDNDRVMPPLGILSLQSYLINHGVNGQVCNTPFEKLNYNRYTHFGISATAPQADQAHVLAERLKYYAPDTPIILGGAYPTYDMEAAKKGGFDYLVSGDGEKPLLRICSSSAPVERVLWGSLTQQEMNDAPLPWRTKPFLSQYEYYVEGDPATTILTARGCPNSCAFCEHANTWLKFYTPEYVGYQIQQVKDLGYNAVMFFDDIFAFNQNRVNALCHEIKKHNIKFRCFAHAKTFTGHMAYRLREAGCVEVGFGAESGSQKILDNVGKNTDSKDNYNIVIKANDLGIAVKAFLILGLPGEDSDSINQTRDFLKFLMSNHPRNDFDLTIFYPYKGTKIRDSLDRGEDKYDLRIANDYLAKGVYKGVLGGADCIVSTRALSKKDILGEQRRLLKEFKR